MKSTCCWVLSSVAATLLGVAFVPGAIGMQQASPDGHPLYSVALTSEQMEILDHMSIVYLDDGLGGSVKTLRISGVNVQVVDGTGTTDGVPTGAGNLIVGYNEPVGFGYDNRTGSHNLVSGKGHSYTRFGGLVVGRQNSIFGDWSSVSGGRENEARGYGTSISGGSLNLATGYFSSVSGGTQSTASGDNSTVTGWEQPAEIDDELAVDDEPRQGKAARGEPQRGKAQRNEPQKDKGKRDKPQKDKNKRDKRKGKP